MLNAGLASQFALLNTAVNQRQPLLTMYSEGTQTNNSVIQTSESNGAYLTWSAGPYTNVTGHQVLDVGAGLWVATTPGATGDVTIQAEFQAGTCSEILMSVNNGAAWTGVQEVKYALSTSWLKISWIVSPYSTGNMNFHAGLTVTGSSLTQAAGNVHMRNLHIWRPTGGVAISKNTAIAGILTVTDAVTCVSVHQTSDKRIKTNIEPADLTVVQRVFDEVETQTYDRTDGIPGHRIGFIANHFENALKDTGYDNIMGKTFDGRNLLTIDHSRLTALLWAQCKNLQKRIEALEAAS